MVFQGHVKKIIGCIAGGGIALVTGLWACMTDCCSDCCCEDALEEIGEVDEDEENEFGLDQDGPIDPNQQALNTAADYMEDPDVQEQMQRLLEDPENLEDPEPKPTMQTLVEIQKMVPQGRST